MRTPVFDKIYWFISADNKRVVGWDGWRPTSVSDIWCNGWGYCLTRKADEVYDTKDEAIVAMNLNIINPPTLKIEYETTTRFERSASAD